MFSMPKTTAAFSSAKLTAPYSEFKHLMPDRVQMDEIRHKLQESNSEEDELLVGQFQLYKIIDVEIEKESGSGLSINSEQ